MNKAICHVVLDAAGEHAQGINTHDADHAARWAREVCRNVKNSGFMAAPYVVHFEPAHHGWPDHAAMRVLRRLGADCSLRNDGIIEVRNATDSVRGAAARLGLDVADDQGGILELHAPVGETHGLDVLKSIHRIHAETVRRADGSIEVRNLYHYPERDAGDISGPSSARPQFLTKRQWTKIPSIVSKRHRVIVQPENKS